MKPSSADDAERRQAADRRSGADRRTEGLSRLPVDRPGVRDRGVPVRPARLDRQLGPGTLDPGYTDERLEAIVLQAAEEARERARSEGYAAGWSQGRQAAAQQARKEAQAAAERMEAALEEDRQRVRRLLAELGKAIVEGRKASIPQWQEVADALADGALQIARSAVARELRSIDDPVAEAVRSALQAIAEPGQAVVHLHPEDATFAGGQPEGIRVVADASVPPGSVLVLTPAQRLLIDLPTALSAAERVLRS